MKLEWDFSELNKFAKNLGQISKFEREMQVAAKELSHELLKQIKILTPIGDSYKLLNGWNGNDFAVKKVAGGFEVLIVNTTEYASAVNNGHYSHNQFNKGGEPYVVNNRTVPFDTKFGKDYPTDKTYVFGYFFVENGILQLKNTTKIEQIIFNKLQKWWDSV